MKNIDNMASQEIPLPNGGFLVGKTSKKWLDLPLPFFKRARDRSPQKLLEERLKKSGPTENGFEEWPNIPCMLYMVTFTINIPQMLAYIPYMDPMGMAKHSRMNI